MQQNDRSKLYIMMDERQSMKDSLRCLRKYGSTSSNNNFNNKLPDEFIKHMVSDKDTLQGIALKYGVTTEQIRRANRLWANDSLFLRESLLIPVRSKSLPSTSMPSFESPNESDLFLNQSFDEVLRLQNGNHYKTDSGHSSASSYKNDDELDNANDFLNRIDADIANKTQQVKLTQNKSVFAPDYSESTTRRKPAMSRLRQQQQRLFELEPSSESSAFGVPPVFTQSKKVRNSLQRLQEKQEELFEL